MRIVNKKATRDYQITDEIEAGIVLSGSEVKSLRAGRGTLKEAFARVNAEEVWLHNFVIPAYAYTDSRQYDSTRPRKLLLHKKQILSLFSKISSHNLTLVPLVCYTTGRLVKIKLGLGKGRKKYEKREALKRKDLERETARELKGRKIRVKI